MTRGLLAGTVVIACACGGASGPGPGPGPDTARTIAFQQGDVSGAQSCPGTGTWDQFLAHEQSTDASAYKGASDSWTKLKAAGATDGYIAIWADKPAECDAINHESLTTGRVVDIAAIHFKDESTAAAAYKGKDAALGIDVSALAKFQGMGGTAVQGQATGLGDNSIEAGILIGGQPLYAAYWEHGDFVIVVYGFSLPMTDGRKIASTVNTRVH
jgi:hypothetical protein